MMAIEIKRIIAWLLPTGRDRRPAQRRPRTVLAALLLAMAFWGWGCTVTPETRQDEGILSSYPVGTVVSSALGGPVTLDALTADLASASVVYVGETHTDPAHHQVQLTVIERLLERGRPLVIGMEMFDRSYQHVLDGWSAGSFDWEAFLRGTHWYANWRYPDSLYAPVLAVARDRGIPLVGLNIPFHIPAKISIGGAESLTDADRIWLPEKIDTSNTAHRAYVQAVFDSHHIAGRDNFENFYTAQCVWEDTMAEAIARYAGTEKTMVVIVGNGHIVNRYGVPDRAFRLTGLPYRTVIPISAGRKIDLSEGDYFWVTEPQPERQMGRP
ncbi:MAG: ChaN family lipoprotein [Pseudomonadota bacterium]